MRPCSARPYSAAGSLSVDGERAKSMPGVVDVVDLGDAVAVVADGYWQASQALKTVQVTFADEHARAIDQDSDLRTVRARHRRWQWEQRPGSR